MKRFNWLRFWLLTLALSVALGSNWVATRNANRPGITRGNFEKIKKGMSPEQVEAILAVGGLGFVSGDRLYLTYGAIGPLRPWEWEEIAVETTFDETGLAEASLWVKRKTLSGWLRGWRDWAGF